MGLAPNMFEAELTDAVKAFDKHVVCLDKAPEDCQGEPAAVAGAPSSNREHLPASRCGQFQRKPVELLRALAHASAALPEKARAEQRLCRPRLMGHFCLRGSVQ